MKLVVSVNLRLYSNDRFNLTISYGEEQASVNPVEKLSDEVAANACNFTNKCHIGSGDNIFYDCKKHVLSSTCTFLDDSKAIAEMRGVGKNEFINDLYILKIGANNPDFILSDSDIQLIVTGDESWIEAWKQVQ